LLLAALACSTAAAQTLTNGFDQTGTLVLHTTNAYTFYATNGDTVFLRIGAPTFRPLLTLHAPNGGFLGAGLGSGSGSLDASITPVTVTTNGLFTVRASSYYGTGSGAYSVRLARIPAAYETSPGDEGGVMINGAANPGNLSLGDLDLWSFTANAGDNIVVRIGATGFRPYLTLHGPNGDQVAVGAGGGSGDTDAYVLETAATSGTFTVVAQAYYANGAGPYTLHLAKAPGQFVVSPGDEGGTLTNGAASTGFLTKGDLDMWSFDATSGDNLLIRMGAPGFRPWIYLYGPTGKLIGTGLGATSADTDALIATTATNTGTFTIVAQSYYYNLSGAYTLNLARIPGAFVVSPGDEGGLLASGLANRATNSLGDLDIWSFTANIGDNLVLRIGAPDYRPQISIYGPGGKLIQTASGSISSDHDALILFQATNSGNFTVVEQSVYYSDTGPYTLNFARLPGTFAISPGDEGGPLTNGISRDGVLELGDLDLWSFAACKGYPVTLTCEKLTGTFTPRIRLYGRNGALLQTVQNATRATLSYAGTNSGTFTALIDGASLNKSGTYRLTGYGIFEDELKLCAPIVSGTNLNFTGYGGITGSNFVIMTTTNVATPILLWTPMLTNQFDTFGTFDHTNLFNRSERERFFRLRSP